MTLDPSVTYYQLEPESCTGYVISGGETGVTLQAVGNDPESEAWKFVHYFDPLRMLNGEVIVNARTGKALYLVDAKKPLTVESVDLGSPNPDAIWVLTPLDNTYWKLAAGATQNTGQSIDQGGSCRPGATVQAWDDNGTSHQRWRISKAS